MAAARIVHHRGAAELVDRLGNEALIPGAPRRLDLRLAVAASRCRLGEDALIRRRDAAVAEEPTGFRHLAARQIDRRRAWPFLAEEILHRLDRRRDAGDQWIA